MIGKDNLPITLLFLGKFLTTHNPSSFGFFIDSKWDAFNPPLFKSLRRDRRLTLSFPPANELKDLLTSITVS